MAINQDLVGRAYPASGPYEVSRVKIAEFADAIGEASELHRSQEAARAAGYPDVIAPPTFAIVVAMNASAKAVVDPELGINYAMVVHGEQRFEHIRPLHAGDVVTAQSTITGIRAAGSLTMVTTQTEIRTVAGEHVCTAHSTIVERGAA